MVEAETKKEKEEEKEEEEEEDDDDDDDDDDEEESDLFVPPDGGWGWVVVVASGLSSFITIPVMQSFALIFSKRIVELDMSPSDLSTIINVNAAFGMGLGIIAGPLLKNYGSRKVALFGAFSSFLGITCTSWATTFIHILVTYSLINSMGTFLLMSAFSLAINTYFRERRGYASGMSTTLTGLGPVCMPHIITFLLRTYGTQGTALILGALASHSILAALLIQPVEWHMKKFVTNGNEDCEQQSCSAVDEQQSRKAEPEAEIDTLSLRSMETPVLIHRQFGSTQQISKKRKSSAVSYNRSQSQNDDVLDNELTKRLSRITNEDKSQDDINTGSVTKIVDDKKYQTLPQEVRYNGIGKEVKYSKNEQKVTINEQGNNNHIYDVPDDDDDDDNEDDKLCEEKKGNILKRLGKYIVALFGLDLLTDPHYVILALGMSLAICAELNFSLFTPLILGDYGFDLQPIATIMSTVGVFDLIFRFLSPFIGGWLKFSNQMMYVISLIMLITARTSLVFFHDYTSAFAVACGLGVAKGFRTVYMGLVIPSYLPLDRLPHGSGIQSALNCLCIVLSIPLMAEFRIRTGDYSLCILALNCITASTVIMWVIQMLYVRSKEKKRDKSIAKEDVHKENSNKGNETPAEKGNE